MIRFWTLAITVLFSTFLFTTQSKAGEVLVRDAESLRTALTRLASDTVLKIAPGEYPGELRVVDVDDLTVEALDPNDPPLFKGGKNAWQFSRCDRLTLRHLRISGQTNNGLNIDDGGSNQKATQDVTIEDVSISDIGPRGNHDGIKCSGIDKLLIRNCRIHGWGGQAIDLVGCHDVRITGCLILGKPDFEGTAGVQAKGGCEKVLVESCHFVQAGMRPLNVGGSTGLPYFRPLGANYEARNITVTRNVISGSPCAAAFVGVDGAEFTDNTVLHPEKWVFRILQETRIDGFIPCRNVLIRDNTIVVKRAQISTEINIGEGTNPETFRFENNRWVATDQGDAYTPQLP